MWVVAIPQEELVGFYGAADGEACRAWLEKHLQDEEWLYQLEVLEGQEGMGA